ncbi:MAG: ABC transporter permease [Defluviitaleaceae bacterium]|nr:ABC transporter permease [Defluviitaleaceae bacterium]
MKNIKAIFYKQFISNLRAPVLLFYGGLFLVFMLIFSFLATDHSCETGACVPEYICQYCEESRFSLPDISMAGMYMVMFVGMGIVASTSALVGEDKTTKNLRFMSMAGVTPWQYLIGTFAAMMLFSTGVILIYTIAGGYFGLDMLVVGGVATLGAMVSVLFGVTMGLSKYPVVTMPLAMLLGMGPMLADVNENVAEILSFTFTQQIRIAIGELGEGITGNLIVIGINAAVVMALFIFLNRKGKLVDDD